MSIIDRNAIFFEGPLKAQATGPVVALTALTLPGRMEPMPVRISVSGWTAVPGAAWTAPGAALVAGARLGPRFLPQGVRASFLRLRLTPTPKEGKTPGKGRIFAALMREDEQPWEAALQKK